MRCPAFLAFNLVDSFYYLWTKLNKLINRFVYLNLNTIKSIVIIINCTFVAFKIFLFLYTSSLLWLFYDFFKVNELNK